MCESKSKQYRIGAVCSCKNSPKGISREEVLFRESKD